MICRRGRRLRPLESISYLMQPTKIQYLNSLHNLSSVIDCAASGESEKNSYIDKHNIQHLSQGSRTILTHQAVLKTLASCPSDLIALSFFLWCAKQPHYFHDRVTFKHMVNVVARLSERFQTVKEIIKKLEQLGCATKPQTFLLLLRVYWCGGLHSMVFEAFEQMLHYGYTPNTFARNIVMDVLFKIERIEVALRVLKETEVPNFLSFSIAICNLCKLNDLLNSKDILRITLKKGYYLNTETYAMVLSCFCKLGRVAEALQLLSLMITLGICLSVDIWSMLINMFCKYGRLDVAYSLLEKMVESGYSPNVVTYTSVIKGLLESSMVSEAFELLNTMESVGCYPDLVLSNVLMHCLSKMGRYDDALDVFFSLQERKLIPDAYTFCSIMAAFCYSRQFSLLPVMLDGFAIQPDLVACNSLISYFCRAGYPSGAIEFYEDMIDKGYTPDKYSFAALLGALCKAGRTIDAVNVYNGIIRSRFALDAHIHTVIVNELIKSGNSSRAIILFRKAVAQKFPLDTVSYTIAISSLLKHGQAEEAYGLMIQMREAGIPPTIVTCNLIISNFDKFKDLKLIKQILQEMVDMGIKVDWTSIRSMKTLFNRSRESQSVLNLFNELCYSGLLPPEELDVLTKLVHGVDLVDALDYGTSSSDDVPEAAVSAN